jgi:hypothetical protein
MSTEQLEEIEELARRAIACKRWRWMPGMLSVKGLRVVRRDDDRYVIGYYANRESLSERVVDLPDLSDPATLGCLLSLVREAWGKPNLYARPEGDYWRMWAEEPGAFVFTTEAAALVAALEGAS